MIRSAGPPSGGALGNLEELPRLDIGVGEEVGLQVGPLVEVALTNGTTVGRLLHVEDLVHCQRAGLAEALAALLTLKGLLFGVDVAVVPEMVLSTERLVADITIEGPLVSVGALMDEQVVGLGELPVAILADEPLLRPG